MNEIRNFGIEEILSFVKSESNKFIAVFDDVYDLQESYIEFMSNILDVVNRMRNSGFFDSEEIERVEKFIEECGERAKSESEKISRIEFIKRICD